MEKCKDCLHEEACAAWIQHCKTLYDDFEYSVDNCPYYFKEEHGRWIVDTSYMPFLSTCSECGALYTIDGAFTWDYCPDCGSCMEGYVYG